MSGTLETVHERYYATCRSASTISGTGSEGVLGKCVTNSHVRLRPHFYHNRVRALPNSRLDKLALFDGFWDIYPPHRVEALSGNWRSDVRRFTDTHGQQIVYDELDISNIVEREKARWVEDFLFDTDHSSLQLYRTVYKANHTNALTICLLSDAIPTGD